MNEKTITQLAKIRYKNATMRATTGELRPRDLIHIAKLNSRMENVSQIEQQH